MIDTTLEGARLDAAQAKLAEARNTYTVSLRSLLASDGKTPIYDALEHESRVAAVNDTFRERMDAIAASADGVLTAIERDRLDPYADPVSRLTGAFDLERASARRPFVAEDCAALPVDQLVNRLAWVRTNGDTASRWLYGRYAAQRFQQELSGGADVSGLRNELERYGMIGDGAGLAPELQRMRERADMLKRQAQYARSQVAQPGGLQRGTGNPIGL